MLPPASGGKIRLYNIFKNLSKTMKIKIFNLVDYSCRASANKISENFVEYNIPVSRIHNRKLKMHEKLCNEYLYDIALCFLSGLSPHYSELLERHCDESKIIVCVKPYLFDVARRLPKKYLVYDAFDVVYDLKKQALDGVKHAGPLLKELFRCERGACQEAEHVIAASDEDREMFSRMYGIDKHKIIVVPNGTDCNKIRFTQVAEKESIKRKLGVDGRNICLFIGNWHKPNLEALLYILDLAETNTNVTFFILGRVCDYYEEKIGKKLPGNVLFFNLVDDFQKEMLAKASDFAINPIFSGGGTNLKMFEYMAAGLPVITTRFGMRGIDKRKADVYLINN